MAELSSGLTVATHPAVITDVFDRSSTDSTCAHCGAELQMAEIDARWRFAVCECGVKNYKQSPQYDLFELRP